MAASDLYFFPMAHKLNLKFVAAKSKHAHFRIGLSLRCGTKKLDGKRSRFGAKKLKRKQLKSTDTSNAIGKRFHGFFQNHSCHLLIICVCFF
ncbi:hypothetical protein Y032_0111g214 [Ancylostoma ceylanicum]|nr:hypothetical protein Y032_0111g214 [Ancylostoma ceylanicum]